MMKILMIFMMNFLSKKHQQVKNLSDHLAELLLPLKKPVYVAEDEEEEEESAEESGSDAEPGEESSDDDKLNTSVDVNDEDD